MLIIFRCVRLLLTASMYDTYGYVCTILIYPVLTYDMYHTYRVHKGKYPLLLSLPLFIEDI